MTSDGNVVIVPPWAEGLTHRERRFVEEYLVDLHPTQAMQRCGRANQFTGKDYANRESAATGAAQMLRKPKVAAAIERALNEVGVTRVWIITELAKIARASLADFVTIKDGRVVVHDHEILAENGIDLSVLTEVSETITEFGTAIKVKVMDRKPALDKLAKLLRMEVERTEISGPAGGPIEMVDPRTLVAERLNMLAKRTQANVESEAEQGKTESGA